MKRHDKIVKLVGINDNSEKEYGSFSTLKDARIKKVNISREKGIITRIVSITTGREY